MKKVMFRLKPQKKDCSLKEVTFLKSSLCGVYGIADELL